MLHILQHLFVIDMESDFLVLRLLVLGGFAKIASSALEMATWIVRHLLSALDQ